MELRKESDNFFQNGNPNTEKMENKSYFSIFINIMIFDGHPVITNWKPVDIL